MNKRLYVGNLPFDTNETALKEMFETEGRRVARVQIIMDKMSGRSRGFGFVEFEAEQDAESAMNAFNGREMNGRALVVNEAREQTRTGGAGAGAERGERGGFGGGGRSYGNDRGPRSPRW